MIRLPSLHAKDAQLSRVSGLLCICALVHASKLKEHDEMTISRELLDELLSGVERPEDLLGDKGLMRD